MRTTSPVRINYAIFGNVEPALHAHVIPRYRTEPEPCARSIPGPTTGMRRRSSTPVAAAPLIKALRAELAQLGTLRTP